MGRVFTDHARRWRSYDYVYPVISRRSKGLSIGINLNIDKACNFDCLYCCVDRSVQPARRDVDLDQVRDELTGMLGLVTSGVIWQQDAFAGVEPAFRRLNDIAFSGDGEPTAYPRFDEACQIAIEAKQPFGLQGVKLIVITNATLFDRPAVQRGLTLLDQHNGEVWAKLDAGTQAYYQLVDRTKIPLDKVLTNILTCGRARPIVIQSLFMQVRDQPLPDHEFAAYLGRIERLLEGGCQIKLVQLYTTARWTAEPYVSPLTDAHLDRLAAWFKQRLGSVAVEVAYGVGV